MEKNFGQRMAELASKAQEEKLFHMILQEVERAANLGETSIVHELPGPEGPEHFENLKLRLQMEGLLVSLRECSSRGCGIQITLPKDSEEKKSSSLSHHSFVNLPVEVKSSSLSHDHRDPHKR